MGGGAGEEGPGELQAKPRHPEGLLALSLLFQANKTRAEEGKESPETEVSGEL